MAATDDQHIGFAVLIGGRAPAPVEPVGAVEVALEGWLLGVLQDRLFLVALQLLQAGEQSPGQRRAGAAVAALQAQDAGAPPDLGLELQNGFDALLAGALDIARRMALGVDGEIARAGGRRRLEQPSRDGIAVAHRLDGPGERHDIAPVAVGPEKRPKPARVVCL